MKSLGVIRRIDYLGRIVIPKEVRDEQGWGTSQPMEMFVGDEGLTMKPYREDAEKKQVMATLREAQEILNGDNYTETESDMQEAINKLETWL